MLLDTITVHIDIPSTSIPLIGVLSLDFSRTFDTVDHNVLLGKVQQEPKLSGFAQWLSSYLSGRESMVRVISCVSKSFLICSRVPQDSILGPRLFFVLVGDLPTCSIIIW